MKAYMCGRIAVVAVFLLVSHAVGAQTVTSDKCERKVGEYDVNFNGYQPASGSNRFCEDIPQAGPTDLTIDFLHAELRTMPTAVRLLEVESWTAALDGSGDGKARVIQDLPAKTYSTGLIGIHHEFKAPGYFVEVVNIEAPGGKKHVLRFPFSVAVGLDWAGLALWATISIALIAGVAFWLSRRKAEEV